MIKKILTFLLYAILVVVAIFVIYGNYLWQTRNDRAIAEINERLNGVKK